MIALMNGTGKPFTQKPFHADARRHFAGKEISEAYSPAHNCAAASGGVCT
jgi:hypothetical protein